MQSRRLLHVAPEEILSIRFQSIPGIEYLSADLVDPNAVVDIETATLLHFLSQRKDEADPGQARERFPPLCVGSADLLL